MPSSHRSQVVAQPCTPKLLLPQPGGLEVKDTKERANPCHFSNLDSPCASVSSSVEKDQNKDRMASCSLDSVRRAPGPAGTQRASGRGYCGDAKAAVRKEYEARTENDRRRDRNCLLC